jgi:hypothetical protein
MQGDYLRSSWLTITARPATVIALPSTPCDLSPVPLILLSLPCVLPREEAADYIIWYQIQLEHRLPWSAPGVILRP